MQEIPCKEIVQKIIDGLKSRPTPKKILAGVLTGKNPASISFLKQKERAAKILGVDFRLYEFPENISQDELRQEINELVNLGPVGGIIIQLPLPKHLNSQNILNIVPPEKDVDVLSERALGAFYTGRNPVLPPAVGVIEEILKTLKLELKAQKIAVLGLGNLIGKPAAIWLIGKCKNLCLLHKGSDFSPLKNADIIISGTGKANLIAAGDLKENAVVIDFGYDHANGKISGDFNPSSSLSSSSLFYTPTPGGTGPILVAKILENFYNLNNEI